MEAHVRPALEVVLTESAEPPRKTMHEESGIALIRFSAVPVICDFFLTPVIPTRFTDFVRIAKVAMVAVFPNVAGVCVEEGVVSAVARLVEHHGVHHCKFQSSAG